MYLSSATRVTNYNYRSPAITARINEEPQPPAGTVNLTIQQTSSHNLTLLKNGDAIQINSALQDLEALVKTTTPLITNNPLCFNRSSL